VGEFKRESAFFRNDGESYKASLDNVKEKPYKFDTFVSSWFKEKIPLLNLEKVTNPYNPSEN